jgi:hypothetical protein
MMNIPQKTVTIQGTEYMITAFTGSVSITLLNKIRPLYMSAIAKASEAQMRTNVILESGGDVSAIQSAQAVLMLAISEGLDKVDVSNLIKQLLSNVTKDSMNINIDFEFVCAYDKMLMLVWEVIQFNFGTVFTMTGLGQN